MKKEVCLGGPTFKGCGNQAFIANRTRKLCLDCNKLRLSAGKEIIKKVKVKPRKVTGELNVFKEIWAERPPECEVCKRSVEFSPYIFSHVLTKGAYPGFRLYKKNIIIKCWEYDGTGCHQQWETGDRGVPKFKWVNDLAQELKEEYYG
jgi:hypothetical protein